MIDGGVPKTSDCVSRILDDDPRVELLVVTHIDNDHIAGMLKVLTDKRGASRLATCGSTAIATFPSRRWRAWVRWRGSG